MVYKTRIIISSLTDLFMLMAMVAVMSQMFKGLLIEIVKRSRNNQIVISISLFSKICAYISIFFMNKVLS